MIRFGTCSWKYDSWKGIVYPQSDKINFLEEYAKVYSSVEIDQWFWSLHGIDKVTFPKDSDVKNYNDSVPDDFRFTIKIPNSITLTHFYKQAKDKSLVPNPYFLSVDIFESFLKKLEPMKAKLGPLMFQFEYLNKQKMSGLAEFIELLEQFLEKISADYQYAVEIRNPNYLTNPYFDFINRNNLTHVLLEGYYMPPISDVISRIKEFCSNLSIIRLHGPDRSGIEEKSGGIWDRILEPKEEGIKTLIELLQLLSEREIDIYLNVNNHFEGSAPLTIDRIKSLIPKHISYM